jgi:hypothetical protein
VIAMPCCFDQTLAGCRPADMLLGDATSIGSRDFVDSLDSERSVARNNDPVDTTVDSVDPNTLDDPDDPDSSADPDVCVNPLVPVWEYTDMGVHCQDRVIRLWDLPPPNSILGLTRMLY